MKIWNTIKQFIEDNQTEWKALMLTMQVYFTLWLVILFGHLTYLFMENTKIGFYVVGAINIFVLFKINKFAREFVQNSL